MVAEVRAWPRRFTDFGGATQCPDCGHALHHYEWGSATPGAVDYIPSECRDCLCGVPACDECGAVTREWEQSEVLDERGDPLQRCPVCYYEHPIRWWA